MSLFRHLRILKACRWQELIIYNKPYQTQTHTEVGMSMHPAFSSCLRIQHFPTYRHRSPLGRQHLILGQLLKVWGKCTPVLLVHLGPDVYLSRGPHCHKAAALRVPCQVDAVVAGTYMGGHSL